MQFTSTPVGTINTSGVSSVPVSFSDEVIGVQGPALGKIACFAVTAPSSSNLATNPSVGAAVTAKRIIRLFADGSDIYYGWYSDGTPVISDTSVSGSAEGLNQCSVIPAGQYRDERPPTIGGVLYGYIHFKTPTNMTGTLRVYPSSLV